MGREVVADGRRRVHPSAATLVGGRPGEVGAVTAEAAMVLPLLVAFALGMVWVFAVAVAQVRVVDAARETARAAARGDSLGAAVARGQAVAPDGSRIEVARVGDEVRVTVIAEVRGPGGLFAHVPALRIGSHAVAVEEPR